MGFRLRITKGKSEGKEFSFTKDRVTVGRNHDNDLVIYDLNISREHFEVIVDKNRYRVRDLGSRNGIRLNDEPALDDLLHDGDKISAGGVEFEFFFSDTQPRIRMPSEERGIIEEPGSTETQRMMLEQIQTHAVNLQNLSAIRAGQAPAPPKKSMHRPKGAPKPGLELGAPAAKSERTSGPSKMASAAEAAKKKLSKTWSEDKQKPSQTATQRLSERDKPKAWRRPLTYAAVATAACLVLVGAFWVFYKRPIPDRSGEQFALSAHIETRSFGAGRTDVSTPRGAQFVFTWRGGRVLLFFTAGGLEKAGEVEVSVNGATYALLPPSGAHWGQPSELKLARKVLHEGTPNLIAFIPHDGDGRWGVREISVTEEPIPPPSLERAKELMHVAQDAADHKRVDPANLYTAEDNFRRALLAMEALDPVPPEYATAEQAYRAAHDELVQVIDSGLFRAERAQRYGRAEEARDTLRELLLYLPNASDPRRQDINTRLQQLDKK